jgi:catechol 2,3-dioxygenase-like lactoylglutathione lyase family enzyme
MTVPVPAVVGLVTLGVRDVPAAAAFYRALGWPVAGEETAEVCFFRTVGAYLALYGRQDLAADAGRPDEEVGFRGVSLAVNVANPAAVDAALAAAQAAGGTVTRPGEATVWGGYSGYFADPDGHAWEVAHNPFWPLDADGRPRIPAE